MPLSSLTVCNTVDIIQKQHNLLCCILQNRFGKDIRVSYDDNRIEIIG